MRSATSLSGVECLTCLCLHSVNITGEMIEDFLSVCPLLERLSLKCTDNLLNLRVVGSSLKLKYLEIHFCVKLESIEICAPSLVSFFYGKTAGSKTNLQVQGLCYLVDLHISAMDVNYEFLLFSSYFSRLETLALGFDYTKIFLELLHLPQFTNLRHLTLKIKLIYEFDISGLLEFINLCPSLHKFTLQAFSKFQRNSCQLLTL